ncbi:hypothetical protein OG462_43465 [Streptomyces sp. NBC_01077]|uniref:DUF6892 domain-containing protein n=1 Tax=Streptomyces sp. NBC_01077 TaxID=2903746 RepID=UPI0038669BF2|nr:hypothetical protein OG462_01540 [Streptomyces sp. NBC_01077]WSV43631.1 hypothetical protein OG462_43465 [Streptomyces sp. NBC_01077]
MAIFRDLNFKLLVIEKLMYEDGSLAPVYNIIERMRGRGIIDPWGHLHEGGLLYDVLDESRAYFEQLEIGDELLATVDEIYIEGGLQAQLECCPYWDGEDDMFDVRSLDDLVLLPNLKRFLGADESMLDVPDKLEILARRGIATT